MAAPGGPLQPWLSLPIGAASDCSFSRDGTRLVCSVPVSQNDAWLVDNFGALLAAAAGRWPRTCRTIAAAKCGIGL
jgi:hypothetical protein